MNQYPSESSISSSDDLEAPTLNQGRAKALLFISVLVMLALLFNSSQLNELIGNFLEYVKSLGGLGLLLFGIVYVLATVLMLPGFILTLGAGFAFGLVQGTVTIVVASLVGAVIAFLVARHFARNYVEQKVSKYPKFIAVDRAVEQAGFKVVLLTRLSPVFPFNALNYLFGITGVSLRDYTLASGIGMIPGTVLYVYFGTAMKSVSDLVAGRFQGGTAEKLFLLLGLVATLGVTIYVTKLARSALREYVEKE